MAVDLDKVIFYSGVPAYTNVQSGSFSVSVTGAVIAPSGETAFSNSANAAITKGSLRMHIRQNPVPGGSNYTSSTMLPMASLTSNTPIMNNGCSVVGDPSATSIGVIGSVRLTTNAIQASLVFYNPYAGNMTLTPTTYTFYYSVYAPTYIV